MTQGFNGPTPQGWYPDPSNPQQMRWWDGVQWTQHVAPGPAQFMPLQRPLVSERTPVYNPFIWGLVFIPLLPLLLLLVWQPEFRFITTRQGATTIDPTSIYSGGYIALQVSGLVAWALGILFAYLDHQRLARSGVVRPFHWAWCFLSGVVYIIGRTVIVRKVAPGRGLAPIWGMIGTFVVSFIVVGIWVISFFNQIYARFGHAINA
ncbi:DUF2510 domain-containing protein [Paenarthrobacter sp. S56]|uniref:DUF2510 domain-containing protein n=1 Tax=Paenarthrobacter sp. S56 TaxID=3138179 RepID=UPI00321B6905